MPARHRDPGHDDSLVDPGCGAHHRAGRVAWRCEVLRLANHRCGGLARFRAHLLAGVDFQRRPRCRIRSAQRSVLAPGKTAAGFLSSQPYRRSDVTGDQRYLRRARHARPRRAQFRQRAALLRLCGRSHAVDGCAHDSGGVGAFPSAHVCRSGISRSDHEEFARSAAADVGIEQPCAGKLERHACGQSLFPGRVSNPAVRRPQQRLRSQKHADGQDARHCQSGDAGH